MSLLRRGMRWFGRLARSVRGRGRSRHVVFVAQDPSDWVSCETLYEACVAHPGLRVSVVHVGWGEWQGISSNCIELFDTRDIEYVDGGAKGFSLEKFAGATFIVTSPFDWSRPPQFSAESLSRVGRIAYVPYGMDVILSRTGPHALQHFGLETGQRAWRIFTRSTDSAARYVEEGGKAPEEVVPTGLPVIDRFFDPRLDLSPPPEVAAFGPERFKILYTPHHSIDGWSTFLHSSKWLTQLLEANPDYFLIFRPHPGLQSRLEIEQRAKEYDFESLFPPGRSYLDMSTDFNAAMSWADVLVSDASSMLFHFSATGRPAVYLESETDWGLDPSVIPYFDRAYYRADSYPKLERTLAELHAGTDPLALTRAGAQEAMVPHCRTGGAGARIAEYLASA